MIINFLRFTMVHKTRVHLLTLFVRDGTAFYAVYVLFLSFPCKDRISYFLPPQNIWYAFLALAKSHPLTIILATLLTQVLLYELVNSALAQVAIGCV